jgi:hypothetical protein
MKLLLENWRKFLTEDEDELSREEKIADLWYNPIEGSRAQAQSLIGALGIDPKELRIWRIYLPLLASRQLDSFWTFAEAEAIVEQLNEEASKTEGEESVFYIKDYQVVNENSFGKVASILVDLKNEEDFVFFSRMQKYSFVKSLVRAFDDAAEKVAPGRFEEGGRHGIDQARFDRNYD